MMPASLEPRQRKRWDRSRRRSLSAEVRSCGGSSPKDRGSSTSPARCLKSRRQALAFRDGCPRIATRSFAKGRREVRRVVGSFAPGDPDVFSFARAKIANDLDRPRRRRDDHAGRLPTLRPNIAWSQTACASLHAARTTARRAAGRGVRQVPQLNRSWRFAPLGQAKRRFEGSKVGSAEFGCALRQ